VIIWLIRILGCLAWLPLVSRDLVGRSRKRHPATNRKQPRSVALVFEPTEAPKLFKALPQ
jgi:hypothetical protein